MVDLTSYTSLQTSLFVRLQVDEYRTTSSGSYTSQVLKFSDHNEAFTIDTEVYTPLGRLLAVTSSASELRSSNSGVTITLSGIPSNALAEILYSKIKGAPVKIYRGFFNSSTNAQIGATIGRFIGTVNNYSIEEEYDIDGRASSHVIILECNSITETLESKISGRKTSPTSMKKYFTTDTSFDRIPNLEDTSFNFGAPQ